MEQQAQTSVLRTGGRNYGIDLLKFVSMFMVVVLHILSAGGGGVLAAAQFGTQQYIIAWLMECAAYGAVNCFAMTSGYLMVDKSYKTARLLPMWLQVLAYSLSMTAVQWYRYPGEVDKLQWFRAIFPASTGWFWYFSAYVGLFFLMPFINKLVQTLTRKQALRLAAVLLFVFTAWEIFPYSQVFDLADGYSLVWLGIMYYLGACMKYHRFGETLKKRWAALVYVGGVALAFGGMYLLRHELSLPFKIVWLSYTSPAVVLGSIGFVLLFTKITIKPKFLQKIVVTLSSVSFGVYIVHSHPLFWNHFLKWRYYRFGVELIGLELVGGVLLAAAFIFVVCGAVDWVREQAFKLCRINKLCRFVGDKIDARIKPSL